MQEPGREAADDLQRADPDARARAALKLQKEDFGAELSRALEDRVFDPDPEVRVLATALLPSLRTSESPELLFSALEDPCPDVVVSAAEALAALRPPRAADALTECLASRPDLAGPIALAMARLGDSGVEELLLDWLGQEEPGVQVAVLRALGACGTERSVRELSRFLEGGSPAIRTEVLSALALIRERIPSAVGRAELPSDPGRWLAGLIESQDRGAVLTAISLIAWLRPQGGPRLLLGLLESPDPSIRERAREVFGAIAAAEGEAVLEVIAEAADVAPASSATALDRVPKAREASSRAACRKLLAHPDAKVRERSAALAGRSGGPGIAESLAGLLEDPVGHVRARAAEALGTLRWESAGVALERLLSDPYPDVREAALFSLRSFRDYEVDPVRLFARASSVGARAAALRACDPRRAGDAFLRAISDPEAEVRLAAATSLKERALWREEAAVLLADEDPRVRAQALRARLSGAPTRSLEPLARFLHDEDPGVRQTLALGLAQAAGVERVEWLRQLMLRDPCVAVARAAARALADHHDPQTVGALLDAVSTGRIPVAARAIESLGSLGDPDALPRLRAVARGGDPLLRDAAARAAARIEESRR
ncbi:MAG: HEAT repeat domain-containing protein [Candidatus Latescibacteria bacterium]|nr:HEAT repeat domain-containing protein [Candidatus Latescibacterota bacterium]